MAKEWQTSHLDILQDSNPSQCFNHCGLKRCYSSWAFTFVRSKSFITADCRKARRKKKRKAFPWKAKIVLNFFVLRYLVGSIFIIIPGNRRVIHLDGIILLMASSFDEVLSFDGKFSEQRKPSRANCATWKWWIKENSPTTIVVKYREIS